MTSRIVRQCLVAVAAFAVLLPAGALAAKKGYVGAVVDDSATEITFVKKNRNGKRFVKDFTASGIRADCTKGKKRIDLSADAKAKVRKRKFILRIDNGVQDLKFKGRFRKGGKAKGILRYSGLTEFDNGKREDCETSRLEWKAAS